MQSIDSNEKVFKPTMTQGEAPQHTHPEHQRCAYYVVTDNEHPKPHFIEVECSHGFSAGGAFYNEDYVNDIRRSSHRLITALRAANLTLHRSIYAELKALEELTK